jgi:MFS transporter, PAT family, beta-lactamase induction signal transducer AmpG
MHGPDIETPGWRATLRTFLHPRVVTMLFLGFSAGIPILLIFSSLSLWLREAGVERAAVTFFSWAALGYSFKFVWAPLIDRLPVPGLTRLLGRRRAWMLVAQGLIIAAILGMASTNPASSEASLTFMALAAVLLGFSSATQDIVIDAYRIEAAATELQAMMSATYIAGYRIGMLVAGAGALFLAGSFGTEMGQYRYQAWRWTYAIMAATMLIGVTTTLLIAEPPQRQRGEVEHSTREYLRFVLLFILVAGSFIGVFFCSANVVGRLQSAWSGSGEHGHVVGFIVEALRLGAALLIAWGVTRLVMAVGVVDRAMVQAAYVDPVRDFFRRYGAQTAWLLLALVGVYRISDIVLGVIANVFYQDLGFSKAEIAAIVKTFGLFMTIAGGFLGGVLAVRYGVIRILMLGAVLSAVTNLLFMLLAYLGHDTLMLYVVISADNLSAGLASAAFVAFLSSLTSVSFTAVQYAIFSSLMTLFPKLLGGYSGSMVEAVGYPGFFILTTILGLPVLVLVWRAGRQLELKTG